VTNDRSQALDKEGEEEEEQTDEDEGEKEEEEDEECLVSLKSSISSMDLSSGNNLKEKKVRASNIRSK
jgi:hypothetical protein